MVKKWFFGQKGPFLRSSANIALNAHFLAKNNFFTITTPKPGYIYPDNFYWDFFLNCSLWVPGVPISIRARLNIFQICFSEHTEPPGSSHTLICSVTGQKTLEKSKGLCVPWCLKSTFASPLFLVWKVYFSSIIGLPCLWCLALKRKYCAFIKWGFLSGLAWRKKEM